MRQAFLLELHGPPPPAHLPDEILASAVQALGKHLDADRVGYGQIEPDHEIVVLETCYANGVKALGGDIPAEHSAPTTSTLQRWDLTVAVDDVALPIPATIRRPGTAIETRAFVSVPLVRGGRLRATLFVNRRDPHAWSADEVGLIEDVAGRIWDALERARAEEALRRLNATLERQVESAHARARPHVAPRAGAHGGRRRQRHSAGSQPGLDARARMEPGGDDRA